MRPLAAALFPRSASPRSRVTPFRRRPEVEQLECRTAPAVTGIQLLDVPDDPFYADGSLYGMQKIDAPGAWQVTTGSTSVIVANIDTGVDYTHPDLYLNIWINQAEIPPDIRDNLTDVDGDELITFRDLNHPANAGYVFDLNGNGYIDAGDILRLRSQGGWANGQDTANNGFVDDLIGWNFVHNNNNPFDDHGHGTHTAGTTGAIGNNGEGVVGVAWNVQIMPLKFITAENTAQLSWAADAIRYAADNGAQISNNSWGYYGGFAGDEVHSAINYARDAGHLFVAAAGNDGFNNDRSPWRMFPASFTDLDNLITVTATDSNDNKPSWANTGKVSVHLGAPGVSIGSTVPGEIYGFEYAYGSGTSMATPHVAGAAALILAEYPDLRYDQVREAIFRGVDVVKSMKDTATGGRLNVSKALAEAGNLGNEPTTPAPVEGDNGGGGPPPGKGPKAKFFLLEPDQEATPVQPGESALILVTADFRSAANTGVMFIASLPLLAAPVLPPSGSPAISGQEIALGNFAPTPQLLDNYLVSRATLAAEVNATPENDPPAGPQPPAPPNPEAPALHFLQELIDRLFSSAGWLQLSAELDSAEEISLQPGEMTPASLEPLADAAWLTDTARNIVAREMAVALVLTGLGSNFGSAREKLKTPIPRRG